MKNALQPVPVRRFNFQVSCIRDVREETSVHYHHQKNIFWGTVLASKKNFPGRWWIQKPHENHKNHIYHRNLFLWPPFLRQRKVLHWRAVCAFFFPGCYVSKVPLQVGVLQLGHNPSTAGTFRKKFRKKLRKEPGNALRAFAGIPLGSTAGIPQNPIIQGISGFQSISRILSPPVQLGAPLFSEVVPERACQSWSWNSKQYWGYF